MKSAFVAILRAEKKAAAATVQRGWRTFRPRVCTECNQKVQQFKFVTSEAICKPCYKKREDARSYEDYIECYVCGARATDGPYWGFCSRRCMNS